MAIDIMVSILLCNVHGSLNPALIWVIVHYTGLDSLLVSQCRADDDTYHGPVHYRPELAHLN